MAPPLYIVWCTGRENWEPKSALVAHRTNGPISTRYQLLNIYYYIIHHIKGLCYYTILGIYSIYFGFDLDLQISSLDPCDIIHTLGTKHPQPARRYLWRLELPRGMNWPGPRPWANRWVWLDRVSKGEGRIPIRKNEKQLHRENNRKHHRMGTFSILYIINPPNGRATFPFFRVIAKDNCPVAWTLLQGSD